MADAAHPAPSSTPGRRSIGVARLVERGRVELRRELFDPPSPGFSVVRVTSVGLCGSDLHWFGEGGIGDAALDRPLVLGHEITGVVTHGPLRGRRIAVDPAIPCDRCHSCRAGHRNLCPQVRFAGHGTLDGGLQELLSWPDALLVPLPDAMTDEQAALLEPLGVALHAVDLGHVGAASSVAVVGCGPVGLLILQVARAAGATAVAAVEPLAHRRAAARRVGADVALDVVEADGVSGPDLLPPTGADVVFDAVGSADAVATAVRLARPGGRVVLVGIPDDDETRFPASVARRKGLTLTVARRMGEVYPRVIRLVERGWIEAAPLVTHRFPLSEVAEAFTTAVHRDGIKVVVTPSPADHCPAGGA